MSLGDWLARRTPPPPEELRARIGKVLEATGDGDEPFPALASAAFEELDRARRSPGRVRESAFHLLSADALLTYACEAALDLPDPDTALRELVERAASSER